MKKTLLALALSTLFAFSALAQDKRISGGIKASLSGNWIGALPKSTNEIVANKDNMQLGFMGGLWFRIRTPLPWLSIQPELTFSRQNGRYTYQFNPGGIPPTPSTQIEYSKAVSLNSLNFPISLGIKIPLGDALGIRVNLGGNLSGILSADQIFTQSSTNLASGQTAIQNSSEKSISDQVNRLQLGVHGGIGIDFANRVHLDITLQQNLTNLYSGYDSGVSPSQLDPTVVDQRNQKIIGWQATLGVRLF